MSQLRNPPGVLERIETGRPGCYRSACGAERCRHSLEANGRAPAPSGSGETADEAPSPAECDDFPGRRPIEKAPSYQGFFRSRPVSRILSWVTIYLCGVPGPSAGRVSGTCLPCTGRGLASRRVATTLVGSYPTVSPLPAEPPETLRRRSAFCSTFRRLSPPGSTPASCPSVSGLSSSPKARGHPACTEKCSRAGQGAGLVLRCGDAQLFTRKTTKIRDAPPAMPVISQHPSVGNTMPLA